MSNPVSERLLAISGKDRTPTAERQVMQKRQLDHKVARVYEERYAKNPVANSLSKEFLCAVVVIDALQNDLYNIDPRKMAQTTMQLMINKVPQAHGRDIAKLTQSLEKFFAALQKEIKQIPEGTDSAQIGNLAFTQIINQIADRARDLRQMTQDSGLPEEEQMFACTLQALSETDYVEIFPPGHVCQVMEKSLGSELTLNWRKAIYKVSTKFIQLFRAQREGSNQEKLRNVLSILRQQQKEQAPQESGGVGGGVDANSIEGGVGGVTLYFALRAIGLLLQVLLSR